MIFKRVFFLTVFLLIGTFLFSQTEVVLWHSYRAQERAALEEAVDLFNKEHSDIQVKILGIPFDAFPDKITAAIPRGKGPDLFIFAHDRIGGWVEGGVIESIDFYLEENIQAKYVEGAYKPMEYKGSIYGLPMSLKSVILYYNPEIIDNPPKTTNEMIDIAKNHTNKEKGEYGLVYEIANFYYHACWLQGMGGRIFNENNIPVLNSKPNIKSFQFAQDLFLKEEIVPPEVSNVLVTTLFNESKAAMVISGPWFRGEIKDVPYEIALLPIISSENKRAMPFMSSEGVMMSAKSQNKEAAFEVMKFLSSEKALYIMANKGNQPVAIKSVYNKEKIKNDKYLPKFKEQIKYSKPMPSIPQMTTVWSPATTALNSSVNGNDPKEELDKAQQKIMEALKAAGFIK